VITPSNRWRSRPVFNGSDDPPANGPGAKIKLRELADYGVLSLWVEQIMKTIKNLSVAVLTVTVLASPLIGRAADDKEKKTELKPYKLENCVVSDEKLGEMGKPFVMEYKGQEIKLCCKNCKKDFDKDPAKYMKKMAEEEKKAAAGKKPKADK
jgi:YHS domain-containing protein